MRLLVTGGGGGLGRAFCEQVPSHHEVVALAHADLDIGDHHAVMQAVAAHEPQAILNFAAFTAVDANEHDPARAFRDNAQGPQSLAIAARAGGAMLLHVSTDFVFDGTKGSAYDETDDPRPLSVYGRSKLAGERLVREGLREHFIVRTGWLFGAGGDFFSTQVGMLQRGEPAAGIEDRIGSPTYVRDLAARLLPLMFTGRFGTYHLAGREVASWYQVLRRCKDLGAYAGDVTPQHAADLGLAAPRPAASALTSVFVENLSLPPFPSLDDAVAAYLGR